MKLMVIGGGGREHAIIKKLKENPAVEKIYCLPGNGGIAADAVCVSEIGAKDIPAQVEFAKAHGIDYAVVAPDAPLALGAVDALSEAGIPCFGPDKKAAVIEASKAFAKDLMQKYNIPTAKYRVFTDAPSACAYIDAEGAPIVVKADGLALGKGVVVAQTVEEAKAAVRAMIEDKTFGQSGARVVIEEYMEGPEISVLSFTDGETLVPMVSSMDHKRALDGDLGPNTGGMGTVAPNPYYTKRIADTCMQTIFLPTIRAMAAEGRPFRGCLYFGLMLTADGPKVIEYNCRFGDPETQVVLPLLKSDLLTVMMAVEEGRLAETPVEFLEDAACCVVVASGGYPGAYESGKPISFADTPALREAVVYHAGTKRDESGALATAGGRVLGVTAIAGTLAEAREKAYHAVEAISFENAFYRKDIGARALAANAK